jgi:hypothetical protein
LSSTDKPFGGPGTEERQPDAIGDEEEIEAARAANKFDIRRLIGALFCLYSLILIALGIFGSHTIKNKADGVNIDLWTGLAMLAFGALMIFWALSRPTVPQPPKKGSGRPGRAPATGR